MSSLSDVASFAFSGATAKALASLITDRVLVSSPTSTSSSKIDPPAQPSPPPPPPPKPRFSSSDFIQHADSVVYFIILTVASTHIAKFHGEHCSTGRTAAEAFVSGGAAGLCMRLISDVVFHKEKAGPEAGSKSWPPDSGGRALGDWRQRLVSRFTWPALEEDLLFALDPALTSCLYKILDRLAIKKAAANSKRRSVADYAEISATTFVVAALTKAIAATITYPLHTAKQRREQQAEANAEGEGGIGSAEEKSSSKSPLQARNKARENGIGGNRGTITNSRLLSVLLRFARTEGFLALYPGWLRAIALASLTHGITKTGHELLEKLMKKLLYALASVWGGLALQPPNAHNSRPPLSSSTQARQPPERGVPDLRQQQLQQLQQQLQQQVKNDSDQSWGRQRRGKRHCQIVRCLGHGKTVPALSLQPVRTSRLISRHIHQYANIGQPKNGRGPVRGSCNQPRSDISLKMYGVVHEDDEEEGVGRIIVNMLSSSQRRAV